MESNSSDEDNRTLKNGRNDEMFNSLYEDCSDNYNNESVFGMDLNVEESNNVREHDVGLKTKIEYVDKVQFRTNPTGFSEKYVQPDNKVNDGNNSVVGSVSNPLPSTSNSDFSLKGQNFDGVPIKRNGTDEEKIKDYPNQDNYRDKSVENRTFQKFGTYIPPFTFVQPEKKVYSSSYEYFADLRLWLQQAVFWQSVSATFPYFLMCQQLGQTPIIPNQHVPFNFPSQLPFQFPPSQGVNQQSNVSASAVPQRQQAPQRQQIIDGVQCKIPSFWKRIVAEFIDFLILFFVKITVTYVAIDFFHLVDFDQLDILHKDSKLAYKQIMQLTQEIVILELIHRLIVCVFETCWLRRGYNGQIGGATPGKSIMGLRVIQCESSVFVRENEGIIIVRPGTDLGLATAFFRSVAKNFVLALLVPTSFAFIFFPHNRTGYDMICSTIVVEDPIIPNRIN